MAKMDERERDAIETEIIAVQAMFEGATLVPVAIALALLDSGLLERKRLLAIIASLRTILAYDYEGKFGSIEDAEMGLQRLEDFLTGGDWHAGRVVQELQQFEASEQASSLLRAVLRQRE